MSAVALAGSRGDHACDHLYRRHQFSLVSFARLRGCDEHEAWDVVQDLFLRVFKRGMIEKLSSLTDEVQRAWLLRMLRWEISNYHRHRSRHKRGGATVLESLDGMLEDDQDVPVHITPATEHDRRWALAVLERGLSRLCAATAAKMWIKVEPFLCDGTTNASNATRVAVHRARCRLRDFIRSESCELDLFQAASGCN
jgi:DNA-directed RNA polymerase specialized sigma24 family protein